MSRRWITAAPFVLSCTALWMYAGWAYEKVPHIRDLYHVVNSPVRFHRPESTTEYLFGFVAAATICACIAGYLISYETDMPSTKSSKRFGMAVLVMLIFGIGALARLHSVRALYGF